MGYIHPEASNEQECVDINECEMFDNLCVFGRCENKEGSFQCVCQPGYILDSSGGNCTGIPFQCVCQPGYIQDSSGGNCIGIPFQ